MESDGFHEWIRATRQRPVYFIHDLIPITHAEYCRAGEQGAHERRLEVMLSPQSGLISNSNHTLDMLRGWARARDLSVPPSVVAPLAPARLMAQELSEPPLQRPYFVILGTIEPRKNHLLLLNIWREMAGQCGASTPHLLVIGQRGWECENVVDMLERCAPLQPFVHEVRACHDLNLARYLRHARALLFPSFAEGYGMPLVEALMLGTPVIASDLHVFREIAGEVPEYLNPLDAMSWMQAVADYTGRDSVRRSAQLERMRNFQVPSWDTHFAQVEQLLAQMA